MSKSVKRVARAAEDLGLSIEIKRMGESTRTAQDAARACGCEVSQIVKSLIFQREGSGEFVLLLVQGDKRVSLDRAAEAVGSSLERADAAKVRSVTGFAIGGVSPIGSLSPLPVWIDRGILAHASVWAAAGAPDAVFEIASEHLRRATNGTLADFVEA